MTDERKNIINGRLMAGDALPSMRTLAKDLRISVITTKRAYNDLEREGVIETITGKGSFVAARNTEVIREVIEDGEHSVLIVSHITSDLDKVADYITINLHISFNPHSEPIYHSK